MVAKAGSLVRVTHLVEEVAPVAEFYERALGLTTATQPDGCVLVGPAGGLRLELVAQPGAAYEAGSYGGLLVRVASVEGAVAAATACGGTVLAPPTTLEHGASLVPDEPDELVTPVLEATVADPGGYPVLLYQPSAEAGGDGGGDGAGAGAGTAAFIGGARLDVHDWKRSQEWWHSLGWATRRWQSNVPRESSLTLTVAAAAEADAAPVSPRGPASCDDEPVVQLTYRYGSGPVRPEGCGLHGLALADATQPAHRVPYPDRTPEAAGAQLDDPDGYRVVMLE